MIDMMTSSGRAAEKECPIFNVCFQPKKMVIADHHQLLTTEPGDDPGWTRTRLSAMTAFLKAEVSSCCYSSSTT